jgi:pilus assembly protein CpaE
MPEKILIVDDDLDTLKLVGLILQRHGYQIVAANGGTQALAKAVTERPDIILLDVMMPDMDGYEVTRRLRADTAVAHIPIIMFTAKTLLDDKVAGFEAGADDYLTKPTHPAELVAHVKALLARSAANRAFVPAEHARIVGFIGAKGGVGTTTVAINVAATLAQMGQETILADVRPGNGSAGLMLGIAPGNSLAALATKPVGDLNQRAVNGQLVSHACGIRVLQAAPVPKEASLVNNVAQIEAIVKILTGMCKMLLLDLGTGLTDANRRILPLCDHFVAVTDQTRVSLMQTKALITDIVSLGLAAAKVEVVAVNRAPASNQLSWSMAEQIIGQKVAVVVSPAVELAYQSADVGTPLVLLRPDALPADQFRNLANQLLQKVRPAGT